MGVVAKLPNKILTPNVASGFEDTLALSQNSF